MTEQNKDANCNENCCKKMSCCGGNSQRASLGRILLGVLILSAMFFWGVKFGIGGMDREMNGKGDRGGKSGCMMGKSMHGGCSMKDGGCGMMQDDMMKNDMMPPASGAETNTGVEEVQPTEAPQEELTGTIAETGTGTAQ